MVTWKEQGMTVAELIKQLNGFDQNAKVYLSHDAEGNSYSPLLDVAMNFVEEEDDNGDLYITTLTEDDKGTTDDVVLFPVV